MRRRSQKPQLIVVRSEAPLRRQLRDVHSESDGRKLALERAGVKGLRYPICVLDRANGQQHTVAEIDMSVSLPLRKRSFRIWASMKRLRMRSRVR